MSGRKRSAITGETISLIAFFAVLGVVVVAFAWQAEHFLTSDNILLMLKHVTIAALVGLGLTFVIAVAHADMSFPLVGCLSGMTMSFMIAKGLHPIASILIGCGVGGGFGIINGIMVGRFKLPDMVATIAMGSVAFGLAYVYSDGKQIFENFQTSGIKQLSDARILTVPLPVVIMAAAYLLGYLLLHRSKYGRRFYAIGSNRLAARFSGIRVERYIAAAFILSGVLAAVATMITAAGSAKGDVSHGVGLLMPAYASVFVGIAVFKKPTLLGTFLGALLVGIMQDGVLALGKPYYVTDLVVGIVLIVTIVISRIDFAEILRRRRLRAELATQREGP